MRKVILSLLVWTVPAAALAQGASPRSQPLRSNNRRSPLRLQPRRRRTTPISPRAAAIRSRTSWGSGVQQSVLGAQRPIGPAGITVDELSVRGIMQSRGRLIATIQGPDNKSYVVHAGDKLLDGVIKAVTIQGLVIVQEVNDPLSLVKQREVIKRLRSQEDAK